MVVVEVLSARVTLALCWTIPLCVETMDSPVRHEAAESPDLWTLRLGERACTACESNYVPCSETLTARTCSTVGGGGGGIAFSLSRWVKRRGVDVYWGRDGREGFKQLLEKVDQGWESSYAWALSVYFGIQSYRQSWNALQMLIIELSWEVKRFCQLAL